MATEPPQSPGDVLVWLGEQQTQLSTAVVKLRGLYKRETDLDDKQERFKILSECQGCLNKVKRMIAERENENISLKSPEDSLIAKTEELADALEQERFRERRFAAHLKLFTDIAKGLGKML